MQDVFPSKKDRTVRIDWKLPARLRRPIGEQLKKDRLKKHPPKPSVRFNRKKIDTKPERNIALPSHRFFSSPAISTTADISRNTPTKVAVMPPPYIGAVARGARHKKIEKKHIAHKAAPARRKSPKSVPLVVPHLRKSSDVLAKKLPEKKVQPLLIQERDIAYSFHEEPVAIEPRKNHIRIVKPKMKVRLPSQHAMVSALLLVGGFAFVLFFVWNLQGAGRGTAALSSIEAKGNSAFTHVLQAQEALANTNVQESEGQFSAASQELTSAKTDMDEALAASKNVLQFLDVTGTVRSGQDMLDVGVALADAGVHMSRAVAPFLSVTLNTSLADAIIAARPNLENAEQAIDVANEKIAGVETGLLPDNIAQDIEKLKVIIPQAKNTLHHLLGESGTLLALLGAERDRQYLVLFANSDEIRPVGGFIGTVGLINVSRGKVENIDVRSVYDGDGQLKKFLAPPNPLLPITNRWYLRDSNWFVDYQKSARKAAELFEKEGGPTVDGVIMLTPKVIQNLLAATGPIQVPGYDTVVSSDNFVRVTQAEVTYDYDRKVNKPKQFLSDLTPILLTKLFSSSGESGNGKMKTLQALTQSLGQKDLLLYFADSHAEEEATNLGWAGVLPKDAEGFLMVNNANIGGHKSDQFMEQEIDYRTTVADNGDADVVVTVRRTHHGPEEKINFAYPFGEDPSKKDNIIYQRTLVPKGAELVEAKGFTAESDVPRPLLPDVSLQLEGDADLVAWQQGQRRLPDGTMQGTESGYTFFANWVVTKPGQTSMTLYHYRIPNAVRMPNLLHRASSYALSIARQAGQQRTTVRASVELPSRLKIVESVPASGVTLESDTSFVYRGQLTSDIVPGIVFEKR